VLLPGAAEAQQHAVAFAKSCTQNINRCTADSECADGNECTSDVCATEDNPGSNVLDCLFTVRNNDGFGDSLTVLEATDTVTNGTGAPNTSNAILVAATTGTVTGPGCDAGSDIGSVVTETCTLAFGASISFRSNFYVVQAADPTPLNDLAIGTVRDECNAPGTTGCSSNPVPGGFGAASTVVSGCSNPVVAPSTPCGTDTDGNDCTAPGCTAAGVCSQTHNLDAPSTPCGTDTDGNDCTAPGCTAAGVCSQTHNLDAPSTPCGTDTDGNDCTAPGCTAAGVCDQAHNLDAPSTPCGTDGDPTDCVTPGCTATGVCSQTHNNVALSTPCGTDTDGNDCTSPGCDGAGTCSQTHLLDAPSTPCGTDGDPTDCVTPGCTAAGVCSQTHNNVAVSTPCGTDTDGNDCTAPGCAAGGVCLQNHLLDTPSTPCGTDTDGNDCTAPGCTAAGVCSQTHIPVDCPQVGCGVLVIDEDSIDNGLPPNFFDNLSACGASGCDVNDHIAEIGLRTELPYFAAHENEVITLWTGTVGDEGWFAVETIPAKWNNAGPTNDGLRNFLAAGPGLGSGRSREKFLDKIPNVTPLRATALEMLEDSNACICAVVYDSDISINYDPLNGSLKGANLGIVAFEVLDVSRLTGQSSGSLPQVQIRILDADEVCAGPLSLFDAPAPTSSSEPFDVDPDP
jgi:hypothetical protein